MSDAPESKAPEGPHRFKPGQSGNPGGRPKGWSEVRELARKHGPEAIAGLLSLAQDLKTPHAVRRQAWTDILDRGFGRPTVGEPDGDGQQVARIEYTWAKGEGE